MGRQQRPPRPELGLAGAARTRPAHGPVAGTAPACVGRTGDAGHGAVTERRREPPKARDTRSTRNSVDSDTPLTRILVGSR